MQIIQINAIEKPRWKWGKMAYWFIGRLEGGLFDLVFGIDILDNGEIIDACLDLICVYIYGWVLLDSICVLFTNKICVYWFYFFFIASRWIFIVYFGRSVNLGAASLEKYLGYWLIIVSSEKS